ncbi:NADPH-dependent F420 reductase [Aromatoleum diolicum]|uniref:NADPH-dependent F420 reductase n=1 Tax=Aromatoleum diolicum TaxID=75796 RepID=A0ABX1QG36_9RHOO|nr:NADPH-dependent F420 reductase [Aromatoleum diolicum]NMG76467.1 NADPH-dependent F420 reductase [Aromatoleum diolicum]
MTDGTRRTIGVIGGTGHLGAALARRWVKAGLRVVIGSRDAGKAREAAAAMAAETGREVAAGTNREAAELADIVVVTVPFASQAAMLEEIRPVVAGKIVVDTTVPLVPPKVMRVQLPPEGCAALRAQALLGGDVRLVSAFHNVAAHKLATDEEVECDVLVFGDDKAARAEVVGLAEAAGLRGLHAGALANSAAAEALTSILIFMNKTYAVDGAGVRITGTLAACAD